MGKIKHFFQLSWVYYIGCIIADIFHDFGLRIFSTMYGAPRARATPKFFGGYFTYDGPESGGGREPIARDPETGYPDINHYREKIILEWSKVRSQGRNEVC